MHKLAAPEMKLKTFKEPLLELRYKNRVHTKNRNFLRTLVVVGQHFALCQWVSLGSFAFPFINMHKALVHNIIHY